MNRSTKTTWKVTLSALFLVLPLISFGQSVTMPDSVKIGVGRLAAIDIQHDGDAVEWSLIGDADVFREYDPGTAVKLRLIAYKPQTCWIVVAAVKDGKLSPIRKTRIDVGGGGNVDDDKIDEDDDQPPPPAPEIDDTFGLGKKAFELAPAKDNSAVAKIYRDAGGFLKGVGGNLKYIAADDGTSRDDKNVLVWIRLEMDKLPSAADWKSWRSGMVEPFMASQRAKPRGFTSDDWFGAFEEVAKAVEAKGAK